MPRRVLLTIAAVPLLLFAAACADGDSDDAGSAPTAARTSGAATSASPGASPARGTPAAESTADDGDAATPPAGDDGEGDDNTGGPPGGPPGSEEATIAAEVGGDIAGGDTGAPRVPVSTVPAGGGETDPNDITDPEPAASGPAIIVDLDASTPGIQADRTVAVGDTIRVAIVAANIPRDVSSFNFFLDYDRTRAVAPSYTGGSSADRNPDLNGADMGDGWTCLPAPEGDLDDEGGIEGDGNEFTGRALLSCFNIGGAAPPGTLVIATVEFIAAAAGTTQLSLTEVSLGDPFFSEIVRCESDQTPGAPAPCIPAMLLVQ